MHANQVVPKATMVIATFVALGVFSPRQASTAIIVVSVNDTSVSIADGTGFDFFSLLTGNDGTAFFFGNADRSNPYTANLYTANRVPLTSSDMVQYFQEDTMIPPALGTPEGPSRAYWYDSEPSGGATAGTNFSVYDANEDGVPDTVFRLEFGESLADSSDDTIASYAVDSSDSGINVVAARALLIPEPRTVLLLALGTFGITVLRWGERLNRTTI